MKIKGQLKEKLDAAMAKTIELGGVPKEKIQSGSLKWQLLHYAMTNANAHPQNDQTMGKLMDEIYKTCDDSHLATYLKNYFK